MLAFVFKTAADPYVGKLTYLRVYSGTMASNTQVFNANRGREERIGQLYTVRGKAQEPADSLVAGDIGAVAKLQETTTGDSPVAARPGGGVAGASLPAAAFSVAIEPKTKADLDKLGNALSRLAEEDPTVRSARTRTPAKPSSPGWANRTSTWRRSECVASSASRSRRHVPKVPYRETVQSGAEG